MGTLFFQQYSKLSVPIPLANLKLWLDGDNPLNTNSRWHDKSANNYVISQSVAVNQPTLTANLQNGHTGYVFDGSNDFFNLTTPFIIDKSNQATFFMVVKSLGNIYALNSTNTPNANYILNNISTTVYTNRGGIFASWAGAYNETNYNLYCLTQSNLGVELFFNTVSKGFKSLTNQGDLLQNIGYFVALSSYAKCNMMEIIVYDGVLLTGDRQQVENYLKSKYLL